MKRDILQGIIFPGSRGLFPRRREGQKSGISREQTLLFNDRQLTSLMGGPEWHQTLQFASDELYLQPPRTPGIGWIVLGIVWRGEDARLASLEVHEDAAAVQGPALRRRRRPFDDGSRQVAMGQDRVFIAPALEENPLSGFFFVRLGKNSTF